LQVSFWDLALESDEAPGGGQPAAGGEGEDGQSTAALKDLPPQLLFIHMGQKGKFLIHANFFVFIYFLEICLNFLNLIFPFEILLVVVFLFSIKIAF
jgi:hypothetical protein